MRRKRSNQVQPEIDKKIQDGGQETSIEKMQESVGQNAPPMNSGTDAQSALFPNLGGSTPSRRNNTLYMRPNRGYTEHLTWTYEMNKNLYDIYNEAKQEGR